MTRDSDIDLLVVDREPDNRHEMSVRIRSAIGNIDYPVRPLDPSLAHLLSRWVRKAESDLRTATWLSREGDQFRDAITFHCQQAQLRYHL